MAVAVEAFTPTASGFTAQLTEEIRTENLNLYDTEAGAMGQADVTLRGENGGDVRGTLVVTGTQLSFVASGGVLAPDTYVATLRSAEDAIVDSALGELLDGDGDGTPGGDFVFSFTVGATPSIVVSMPDFARGPTQPVNVPAVGSGEAPLEGLPIRLSETAGVTSMTMTITYDPALLDVSEVKLGRDAPAGSQMEANLTVPGQITLAFFSLDPMSGGPADLLEIVATVPEDAPYATAQVLRIEALEINAGQLDSVGDDAVHVVAFPGDANANRRYDAEDARLIARVGVDLDSGFVNPDPTGSTSEAVLYPTIDPIIIGDVTGLDGISPLDASDILRRVVGLPTPNLPALPAAQAPTGLNLSSTSVAEGLPVGTTVGQFTTNDPDIGDTHTYSLVSGEGDDDNASFTISGNSLQTAAVFDAAAKSSYSIRVRTTDSTGRTLERVLTINVTEANAAPTAIALDGTSVAENAPAGTVVGELSTTDPNAGDTHTYTLVSGEGADDNASFQIVDGQLVTAEPFDFETQSSYSVRVRSTDADGLFTEAVFVITVTDVNEAPTAVTLDSTTVAEDAPAGTIVGSLSTADPDAEDTHTYTLVAGEGDTDNASFDIDGNDLVIAEPLDFEAQSSYSVRVRSTDADGLFTETVFVITLADANQAPTEITLDNTTVAEDAPAGTVVGSLSTADPDEGDTHSYTLVAGEGDTDNASFDIDGNDLVIAEPLDFEAQSSYSVRVRSTDADGLFTETVFVITLADANQAPTEVTLDNTTVAEDAPAGTVVGSLSTADPDEGDTHSYTLVAGEGDTDNASFDIDGENLVIAEPLDFETQSSYSVRVRSTDADGLFTETVFVITLADANQAPTEVTLDNTTVAEDAPAGTVVGSLSTADPDEGDTHSYTIVAGEGDTDNGSFAIDGENLVIAEPLDFEAQSSYSVRVRSTDADGLFTETVFVITLAGANQAPTEITLDNTTVAEDAPAGTVVGSLSTADPDEGDTHSYTLVAGEGDTDNASFDIDGENLVIAEPLDFETQSSYSVRVRSTDADGLFTETAFAITVTDVNEAPTEITLDNTTVAEDAPAGTVVGSLSTADPDEGDTHSYTLVAGEGDTDNASFAIDGENLVIAEPLDFEAQSSYSVRVRSTDAGGLFSEAAFAITAGDAEASELELLLDNTAVPNPTPPGTVIGGLTTEKPSEPTVYQYELVAGEGDTHNAYFAIVNNELVSVSLLDLGATPEFSVRIRSTGADGLFTERVFLITEQI